MNRCRELPSYLLGQLGAAENELFEEHLTGCVECQNDRLFLDAFRGGYDDWAQSKIQPEPTAQHVNQLVGRLESEVHRKFRLKRALAWSSIVGVATSFLLVFYFGADRQTSPTIRPIQIAERAVESKLPAVEKVLESNDSETPVVQLDGDTLGLDKNTRLAVIDSSRSNTQLKLESGRAAFDVQSRSSRETFEVLVAEHVVRVIGTRFQVSVSDPGSFQVAVADGVVEVLDKQSRSWRVEAGNRFEYSQAESPGTSPLAESEVEQINTLLGMMRPKETGPTGTEDETTKKSIKGTSVPLESLDTYSEMIISGSLNAARDGLHRYVRSHPGDDAGWMLLADCERKMEHWSGSVRTYRKVMTSKNARTAATAKYMAAEILSRHMKDHQKAAVLYREYLSSGQVTQALRDSAKVSYARTLIALGQNQQARKILTEVLESPKSSFVSENAQHLLDSLKSDE